ncbi:MAG: hypothetical protein K2Q10_13900, partial [Rhodospirillales bacterium]|nr:hypothetical protein [Rhodospirillales bacterium]
MSQPPPLLPSSLPAAVQAGAGGGPVVVAAPAIPQALLDALRNAGNLQLSVAGSPGRGLVTLLAENGQTVTVRLTQPLMEGTKVTAQLAGIGAGTMLRLWTMGGPQGAGAPNANAPATPVQTMRGLLQAAPGSGVILDTHGGAEGPPVLRATVLKPGEALLLPGAAQPKPVETGTVLTVRLVSVIPPESGALAQASPQAQPQPGQSATALPPAAPATGSVAAPATPLPASPGPAMAAASAGTAMPVPQTPPTATGLPMTATLKASPPAGGALLTGIVAPNSHAGQVLVQSSAGLISLPAPG